jgi:hypothetical protein
MRSNTHKSRQGRQAIAQVPFGLFACLPLAVVLLADLLCNTALSTCTGGRCLQSLVLVAAASCLGWMSQCRMSAACELRRRRRFQVLVSGSLVLVGLGSRFAFGRCWCGRAGGAH